MVILQDLKDFRISKVHVAKAMLLSPVAHEGPADYHWTPQEESYSSGRKFAIQFGTNFIHRTPLTEDRWNSVSCGQDLAQIDVGSIKQGSV